MRSTALAFALVCAITSTGCLSNSHVIPRNELIAIAQKPPEQRGQHVHVIQGFQSEDDPPAAPYESRGGTSVGVVVVHDTTPGPAYGGSGGGSRPAAGTANAKADKAYAYVILAALLGVSLAVTEGARYDGWVNLHPMHPVHLLGPNGEYTWRPLAQLDPETAMWARKAIVRPGEGPWQPLGRRPLSRAGLTYAMTLGYAEMPSELRSEERGFLSHISFGYFPEQTWGLLFDIGLGWAQNDNGDYIVDSRYVLEGDFLPVSAGKFHAGVYGQIGVAGRFEDNVPDGSTRGTIFGGGAMVQLELTTRLALVLRGGQTRIFEYNSTDIGVGIAVY
jgi:hypothetical protein